MSDEEGTAPRAAPAATVPAPVLVPGLHGQVSAFDPHKEEWVEYVERLELYFLANEINDATKKRAILLNAADPTTYRLVKTLAIPGKPTDLPFAEIVKKVKNHFNPKPSPIIKRFEFNTRKQKANETVSEYVAALRQIAEYCEYGATLDAMLRDRLVCGIADKRVQDGYLREAKLSYKEALEMALAAETTEKDSQRLRAGGDCGYSQGGDSGASTLTCKTTIEFEASSKGKPYQSQGLQLLQMWR